MAEQVITTKGLVDRDRLEVKDVFEDHENARKHYTQWYLDGELVRQDCNVNMLRGLEMSAAQAEL